MNLTIMTKNHAADPEIEFLAKSISKSNSCATAMPTAWELKSDFPVRAEENRTAPGGPLAHPWFKPK